MIELDIWWHSDKSVELRRPMGYPYLYLPSCALQGIHVRHHLRLEPNFNPRRRVEDPVAITVWRAQVKILAISSARDRQYKSYLLMGRLNICDQCIRPKCSTDLPECTGKARTVFDRSQLSHNAVGSSKQIGCLSDVIGNPIGKRHLISLRVISQRRLPTTRTTRVTSS